MDIMRERYNERQEEKKVKKVQIGKYEELFQKDGKYYMRTMNQHTGATHIYSGVKQLKNGKIGFGLNGQEGCWTEEELEILFLK